jgi:hypothetical protein
MKLFHAKLPDRQGLEHRALAAIVAPNQQVEPGKVVDLFTHALEVAQGQSSDHSCPPFWQDLGALSPIIFISHHLEHFHDSRSTATGWLLLRRLLAARHALLAAAAQGIGVVPLPVDTARVARPLHGVTPGAFRFQHVIGDGGRVDICGPGSHASTSAISISLRSSWLTKSLSETPLRFAMAKSRPCSSGSR